MANYVWFNGKIIEQATLSATDMDRAWRYGDGGFETIRYNGKDLPLYEYHLRRASQHAQLIQCDITFPEKPEMEDILRGLSEKNDLGISIRCRMSWFRKSGGFYLPTDDSGSILIEVFPFDVQSVKREQKAVLYNDQPAVRGKLSAFKRLGAQIYTDAARFAQLMETDEAIILNYEGNVAETVTANLILREGNSFFAPPVQDGGIEGVMLYFLSKNLPEWGFHFGRKTYSPDELMRVDEILTVNALRGICCITSLFGKTFSSNSLELNSRLPF
jgi:branched-subunit amino acid aminotransferase/4-amino-4-deoxychorismate lyase